MPRTKHSFQATRQALAVWCSIGLLLSNTMPSWAAPSQSPLITRPEKRPLTNFMLTLDDSGSMTYQYLPERDFRLQNGSHPAETISFPNDGKVYMHPDELDQNVFSNPRDGDQYRADVHFVAADVSSSAADASTLLNQMQMRSPQVNSIYYNPAKRYLPWKDASGQEFTPATFSAARLDPMALAPTPSGSAQSVNLGLTQSYTAKWYCSTNIGETNDNNTRYTPCPSTTKSYNPAIVYLLNPNQSAREVLPENFKLFNLNDTATSSFVYPGNYAERNDCTHQGDTTTCSKAVEQQNYANWFVFYRSRLMIAQGAIPAAFSDISNSIRLGWGTIHSGSYNADSDVSGSIREPIVQQGVRNLTSQHKRAFFDWLRSRQTSAGTPSRSALIGVGQYFRRNDEQSPWSSNPGVRNTDYSSTSDLSCRRSFNILVTDGYYRDEPIDGIGNIDGNTLAPNYTAAAPFADNQSDTLADIAMKYWATDLRQDIDNNVPKGTGDKPYQGDPATWQHLNQLMIGLGVTGTLPTTAAQLEILANCTSAAGCWTQPDGSYNLIDDLWHAAVNARGQYFSATDSASLTTAFKSALDLPNKATQKEAGVATAAPTLVGGNIKFVPEYKSIRWTGNVTAYDLDINGVVGAEKWRAEQKVPAHADRNIAIWDVGQGTKAQAILFKPTSGQTAESSSLNSFSKALRDKLGADASPGLIDYLRGKQDTSRRARDSILPDFVNSTPLFVKRGLDLGYASIEKDTAVNSSGAGALTYSTYLSDKAKRQNGILFVGGNGGMLHAFREADGVEQFAFVPYAGAGNLHKLARQDYGSEANFHQFFVDGPLVEADAYLADENGDKAWTNVVLGTMGAGGRSIFALRLDTNDPATLSTESVLWEVDGPSDETATGTTRDDIGYITSEVQVGMLPNGKWKAFVGNGLESQSGRAALLVIDLEDGTVESIVAHGGPDNGLGGVRIARNGATKEVRAVYAGDARGQLWRFDVAPGASTIPQNGASMVVGFKGSPLFTARDPLLNPQPITAAPVLRPHPSGGRLLVFGTGRLFSDADSDTTQTQTIYGVWDEIKEAQSSATLDPPVLSSGTAARSPSSLLVKQEISTQVTVVTQLDASGASIPARDDNGVPVVDSDGKPVYQTSTFYGLSANPVDWGQHKGWLLDLILPINSTASDHPRVIYTPDLFGQSVYVTALTPAQNKESCTASNATGGYGFLLKFLTGSQQTLPSFDTNGNGVMDPGDIAGAGMSIPPGQQTILTRESPLDFETGAGAGTPGCGQGSAQGAHGSRRIQDCEAAKITDRLWRQLLNPPMP